MGFLDRMFSKQQYPELDDTSVAADRLGKIREQLESLSKQVHKPLEVIPEDDGGYVFIGKPPKDFGVAWFENGKLQSFKTLADEGATQQELQELSSRLRAIYEKNQDDARSVPFIVETGRWRSIGHSWQGRRSGLFSTAC